MGKKKDSDKKPAEPKVAVIQNSECTDTLMRAAREMRELEGEWGVVVLAIAEDGSYPIAVSDNISTTEAIAAAERFKHWVLDLEEDEDEAS